MGVEYEIGMKGEFMSAPWNRWFHCIGGTYGSWLPGDPRGFRTRHHREHVEGDYRNPPPAGIYEFRHQGAADSLRFDPVTVRPEDRRIILWQKAWKWGGCCWPMV